MCEIAEEESSNSFAWIEMARNIETLLIINDREWLLMWLLMGDETKYSVGFANQTAYLEKTYGR